MIDLRTVQDIIAVWFMPLVPSSLRGGAGSQEDGHTYLFLWTGFMVVGMTVADLARPLETKRARLYDAALVMGGSAVIGLCAQVAIGGPVPVTGQTFAVLMTGALLGSHRAILCVFAYLMEGLLGLPVFAQGGAGVSVLLGPRGGYLVGFLAVAWIVGSLAERGWDRRPATTVLAMLLGSVGLYACGRTWLFCLTRVLAQSVSDRGILAIGLYPFLVGDVLKIALAAVLLPTGWTWIQYFRLDRTPDVW